MSKEKKSKEIEELFSDINELLGIDNNKKPKVLTGDEMTKFDKHGKPISLTAWAKLLGDSKYKVIKQDHVGDYLVSTVWLGIDHDFDTGKIKIFETMIFDTSKKEKMGEGKTAFTTMGKDVYCDRYSTLEEAGFAHKKVVDLLKKGKLKLYK